MNNYQWLVVMKFMLYVLTDSTDSNKAKALVSHLKKEIKEIEEG